MRTFEVGQEVYQVEGTKKSALYTKTTIKSVETRMIKRWTDSGLKEYPTQYVTFEGRWREVKADRAHVLTLAEYEQIESEVEARKAAEKAAQDLRAQEIAFFWTAVSTAIRDQDDPVTFLRRLFSLPFDFISRCLSCGGDSYMCSCTDKENTAHHAFQKASSDD